MVAFFWWSSRKRRELLASFIHARLLPGLLAGVSEQRQRFRSACLILAVSFAIVALARPQWGFTWDEVKQRGLDIVIAVDISKSMLAEDIKPNRLARAKLAALDLMHHAKSDRLGLAVFAGSAFLQCPLTIDDSVFRQSVEALDVQSVSRGGTAISEAIEAAMGAYTEAENYKVLVLLTDGEDHDSGAVETARKAAEKGLEIFTIGIGTPEGDMVRVKDASGKTDFVRDDSGNVVKTRLNEPILRELAGVSQRGFYLPLRGASVIDSLYEKGLAPIPKREAGEKFVRRYHERYHWPLGIALLLLAVEILFPERKRLKPAMAQGGSLGAVALIVAFCCLPPRHADASAGSASRAYEEGDYERALRDYKNAIQKGKSGADPRLHFNAGNAAFKSRQLEEAASQFNEALSARDLQLQQRAFYNRGNTFFALGDASPDPKSKSEAWQKSIKDFDSALKLNPQDKDAEFNRDFVKKRLEELQQQQQQEQDKKDDQKDESKQDQRQEQKNQDQQQDKSQDQSQQNQQQNQENQSKSEDQKNEQEKRQQDQKRQEQASQDKQQDQKQNPQPAQGDQKEPDKNEQQQASAAPAGQMTPEQARQLLDAQKGEEKMLQFKETEKPADAARPLKDW